ncbi:hypothetical protein ZWY2020_058691 [Hordeum vulgare]|nr:hypothetical protein ZWY2020_058691 [Hordeum vulgare]
MPRFSSLSLPHLHLPPAARRSRTRRPRRRCSPLPWDAVTLELTCDCYVPPCLRLHEGPWRRGRRSFAPVNFADIPSSSTHAGLPASPTSAVQPRRLVLRPGTRRLLSAGPPNRCLRGIQLLQSDSSTYTTSCPTPALPPSEPSSSFEASEADVVVVVAGDGLRVRRSQSMRRLDGRRDLRLLSRRLRCRGGRRLGGAQGDEQPRRVVGVAVLTEDDLLQR